MESHRIERPIGVWLHGLSAIIDLDMDVGSQWEDIAFSTVYFAIAQRFVEHVKRLEKLKEGQETCWMY